MGDSEFLSEMVERISLEKLEGINTVEELLNFVMEFWEDHLIDSEKYKGLMIVFMITQKGITLEEIRAIVGATEK
jgi:hypothetical protein